MDSKTFFEEQIRLGLSKERAVQEAEMYQKKNGTFEDLRPAPFMPHKILKSKPIENIAGAYGDMLTADESFNVFERAKALELYGQKYGLDPNRDSHEIEYRIAEETNAKSLSTIDYTKYNKEQAKFLEENEVPEDHFLSHTDKHRLNSTEPQSTRDRRGEDSNYATEFIDDGIDALAEKNQYALKMKDPFANEFYNDVIEGNVGKPTIFGGIAKGSASVFDQYRYGSWMNWYYHNLSLAHELNDINKINELKEQKQNLERAMGTVFDTGEKNFFMQALSGVSSGIAPLAVETGVPALAVSTIGAPQVGTAYSFYYMQQMGKGVMLDNYYSDIDVSSLSKKELKRIDQVTAGAGIAYAAVERAVGALPFLKLGSSVDKTIAKTLVNKFMKDGIPNKTVKTLTQFGVRTVIETGEEGIQKGIEIGTGGILDEIDPENRKYAIQEFTDNFDKYFSEDAIFSGLQESVDAFPAIALFGLVGMPMDYVSFARDENTVEDRTRFLQINGQYSKKEATEIANDSLLDNKKGKEARIKLTTENYVLAGVSDRKKARDFAERQEKARNTKNAKSVDIDVTEELLNDIADSLSIGTLVQWGESRRLAEKLVNATTKEKARAVQDEIFEELRILNLEQRQQEFVAMGYSLREAYKKALQISNNFAQERKKLQEEINSANTAGEEMTIFGRANMRSLVGSMAIYEQAAKETAERVNDAKKNKASPFSNTAIYSRADFAEIRSKYTDAELKELFIGFPPNVFDMFINALNESGTSEREAQMKYNKYVMTQRDKDYKRWLNFNNLSDNRFTEKIQIDDEIKKQIRSGEADGLALRIKNELNLDTIEQAREKLIEQGEVDVSTQGKQRRFVRKPTRAEKQEIERQATNAVKSLQEISPDTEVVFHDTPDDFIEAVGSLQQAAYKGNKIHINLELMTQELLDNQNLTAHEVGHRIAAMQFVNNSLLQNQLLDLYETIKPDLPAEIVADLEKHAEKYKGENYIPEEYLAQLIGVMARNSTMLEKSGTKLGNFIDTVKGLFGDLPMREESTADMLLNIARSIDEGNIITQEDIAFLRTDLNAYSEDELRRYAEELKLSTEGSKQELVERVNENIQFTGRNNAENVLETSRLEYRRNQLEKARVELSNRNDLYNTNQGVHRVDSVDRKLRTINAEIRKIDDRIQELVQMRASKVVSESPAFQSRFSGSVVTTTLNEPKVMFHATNVLFEEFDPNMGDGGIHVGNQFQANRRMDDLYGLGDYDRIYPLYVVIKNPLYMEDRGAWTESPEILRKQLKDMGITLQETERMKLAERLLDEYYESDEAGANDALETALMENVKYETTSAFIKTIKALGYDGIEYLNKYESELQGDPDESYIVFDKEQLIPAYGVPTYKSMSSNDMRASKIDVGYTLSDQIADANIEQVYENLRDLSYKELQQLGRALKEYDKQRLKNHNDTYFKNTPEYNERYPDPIAPKSLNLAKEDLLNSVELAFKEIIDNAVPNYFLNESFYENIKNVFPPSQFVRASKVERAEIDQFEKPEEKFLTPIFKDQILALLKGEITPEQYVDIIRKYRGDASYKSLPLLPSDNAIRQALRGESKKAFVGKENIKPDPVSGKPRDYNEGDIVESRLDIPAYKDKGVYVVAIHPPRPKNAERTPSPLNYVATVRLKNVTFEAPVSIAVLIGLQETPKNTVATMKGEYVSGGTDASDVENYKSAKKYLNDPEWTQIGYNPYLASYFWTRKDFNPVVSADEVVQIGGLVFAKNAKTTTVSDPRFKVVPTDLRPASYKQLVQFLEGKEPSSDIRFSKVGEEVATILQNKPEKIKTANAEGGRVRSIALKNKKIGGAKHIIDVNTIDENNIDLAADRILEYLNLAGQIFPNFQSWYESRLKIAMDVFGEIDPDAKNEQDQFILRTLMAITSNGNAVDAQTFNSWDLYQDWKKTGKLYSGAVDVTGKRQSAIQEHLKMMDEFIANFGWEKMNQFLTTKGTVKQLKETLISEFGISAKNANKITNGELIDEVVPFSLIFGAKLGSFFNNLSGDFDTVTMDRWFMRTFGRATGSQLKQLTKNELSVKKQRLQSAIDALPENHIIRKNLKITNKTKPTPSFAKKTSDYFTKAENRKGEKKGSIEAEFRLAVNDLFKYSDGFRLIEAPTGGTNRRFIRLAMTKAIEQYNKNTNSSFNPAEAQALLWYFEKLVHTNYGSEQKDDNPDYGSSANKLYGRERGGKSAVSYQPSDAVTGGRVPDSGLSFDYIGVEKTPSNIRASKVGRSVSPELQQDIRNRILAFQKLREGGELETEKGTVFEQGQTTFDTSKKAIERARRLILGEEPTKEESDSVEEWIEQAISNYDITGRRILMANLLTNPRVLDGVERHALAIHKMYIEEQLENTNNELQAQVALNNDQLIDGLQQNYTELLREYDSLLAVLKTTGKAWGQAGVAIRVTKRADLYSSANLISQAEIAKGKKLTYEERQEFAKLAGDIDRADKEVIRLEFEVLKADEKARNDEANSFFQTIAKKKKRKLEDILEERRLILIDIADLGYTIPEKFSGRASKADKDRAALANQIYKLSKNYIEAGANSLDEVVNAVRKVLPHVEAKSIIQIMAERSDKSTKGKTKIAKSMQADLNRAKDILKKIENLKDGIFNPKREVAPDGNEIKTLKQELKYLQRITVNTEADDAKADEIYNLIEQIIEGLVIVETENLPPQAKTEKLKLAEQQLREVRRLKRVEAKILELERVIREDDYESLAIPSPSKEVLNPDLKQATIDLAKMEAEVKNRIYAMREKTLAEKVSEVAGLPRAILASTDMSYALRQGLIVSAGHPVIASKAFLGSVRAAFSENNYRLIDKGIKNNANHAMRLHYGLYFSSIDAPLLEREEMFATNLLDKIAEFPPVKYSGVGFVIKTLKGFSERNMVTGLNLLRAGLFDKFVEDARKSGVTLTDAELEAYANYINVATGRGNLGELSGGAQILSQVFFSPRFTASRIQAPLYAIKALGQSKRLRNEILRQWVALFGVAMTVIHLAKLAGGEADDDPESPFFGKIKIGDVVLDIYGGLLQPFRVIAMTLKAGHVNWIEKDDRVVDVKGVGGKFVKNKLAPPFSIGYELITGKDWMWDGAEAEPLETIADSFTPLIIQSILEIQENDIEASQAGLVLTEFFGTGTFILD